MRARCGGAVIGGGVDQPARADPARAWRSGTCTNLTPSVGDPGNRRARALGVRLLSRNEEALLAAVCDEEALLAAARDPGPQTSSAAVMAVASSTLVRCGRVARTR